MPQWSGYHVKTDGRAYFRLRVPKDLHPHFGQQWPTVNLGMKAGREAERMALMHYIAVQGLFEEKRRELAEEARRPRPVPLSERTDADLQTLAVKIAQGLNRTQYAALRSGAPRSELESLHEALAQIAGDVLSAQGAEGLTPVAEAFLTAAGIAVDREHPNFRTFVFELAAAIDEHYVEPSGRRLAGRHVAPPPLPEAPRVAPVVAPALTLETLVADYIKAKQQAKNQYTRKINLALELFRDMVGADTPITSLRQLHVTNFLRDICRLPSNWAARAEQGVSLASMLAEEVEEVMSPTTYKDNYRAPLKAFLRDSRRDFGDEGFPTLIVDGIEYTGNRKAGEDTQRALLPPELKRLFEGLEFAAITQDIQADALYWLPIIGLYTGARPREICQLNPQCDWGESEGIPFLKFSKDTAAGRGVKKAVKTGEERTIPMHSELVRLGLPAYLERLKQAKADRMFPGVRIKKGNPYEVAGESFTELLKTVGLYDDKAPPGRQVLGMYVMRKTFITFASHQRVVSFSMTGHSEDTTTIQRRHYITEHEPLALMAEELKKLSFPVSIPKRTEEGAA